LTKTEAGPESGAVHDTGIGMVLSNLFFGFRNRIRTVSIEIELPTHDKSRRKQPAQFSNQFRLRHESELQGARSAGNFGSGTTSTLLTHALNTKIRQCCGMKDKIDPGGLLDTLKQGIQIFIPFESNGPDLPKDGALAEEERDLMTSPAKAVGKRNGKLAR
jgi:hypothetical protein